MPNRILRDFTDSVAFDGLSAEAERLFVRLLMKADDFGRFHANPKLVKAACFPLAEDLRANTVAAWLAELSDRQLVFCYTSGTGAYLALPKFRQRSRAEVSKFPSPDGQGKDWMPPNDGPMTVTRPSPAHVFGDGDANEGGAGDADGGCARPTVTEAVWVEKIQSAYLDRACQRETAEFIITALRSGVAPELIHQGTRDASALITRNFPTGILNQYAPKARAFFRGDLWKNPEVHFGPREAKNGKQPSSLQPPATGEKRKW